jgi:hypothetical protein
LFTHHEALKSLGGLHFVLNKGHDLLRKIFVAKKENGK